MNGENNNQNLIISFNNNGAIPNKREMKIRFRNIFDGKITCNYKYQIRKHPFIEIIIKNIDVNKNVEINISYNPMDKLTLLKMQAKDSVTYFEGKNEDRVALFDKLMQAKTIKEFVHVINSSKIPLIYKQRLKECL